MKDYPTFDDALQGDQILYQLASYDVCGGMIFAPQNLEEFNDFQKRVAKRFNHFKKLIQNKETTFEDLSVSVALRNGPFYNKNKNISVDENIDLAIEESCQNIKTEYNALNSIFGDILKIAGGDTKFISVDSNGKMRKENNLNNLDNLFKSIAPKKLESNTPNTPDAPPKIKSHWDSIDKSKIKKKPGKKNAKRKKNNKGKSDNSGLR